MNVILTIRLVIAIVSFGCVGWLIYDFLTAYLKASGSRWTRFEIAFWGSMTIAWQRFGMVVSFVVMGLANLVDYLNLPGVGDALHSYMTPTTVALVFAGFTIISELARRRTL